MIKVKKFLLLIALLFIALNFGSCGGGGGGGGSDSGGGSGGGQSGGGGSNVIQPVSASGQVTAPVSVTPSTLKVVSGIDSKSVNSNGSFSLNLNKDNTQLVMAVNSQDNPVLMAIAVNAQSGSTVSIDVQSTAETLIYLSPGVAQDDPTDAQIVMNYIKALPETTTLANLLASKIATNPDILSSDPVDPEISTALSNAIQALINKVRQAGGIQSSTLLKSVIKSVSITPSSASGVELKYNDNTNELEGRNYRKRYVAIWETNPSTNYLFTLNSISTIGMLTDTVLNLQFTTYTSDITTIANPNSTLTVKAYGLGFSDLINTANSMTSGDWVRFSLPAAGTAVFDVTVPMLGTILGINNLTIKANNSLTQFVSALDLVLQGSNIAVKLNSGDSAGAVMTLIKSSISVLTQNDYAVLKAVLQEAGASAVIQASVNSVFFWAKFVTIAANAGDVILAVQSLATTKLVETFTVTPNSGQLIYSVTSNPSTGDDQASSIAKDSTYMYVVGWDSSPGGGAVQGRIEKRNLSDGQLVTGFGTGGVVTSNPSTGIDQAFSIAIDSTYMYVAGVETLGGDPQWRIEKRNLSDGALVTGFGVNGVVTSNPSTGEDWVFSIAIDSTYMYVAGVDNAFGGDPQWRIEKRSLTDGSLVTGFGTAGAVTSNPSTGEDWVYSIAIDLTYMYVAGVENLGGDPQWRIEKRNLSDGALVTGFGVNGVVTSNPSTGRDQAFSIAIDSTYMYVAGVDNAFGGGAVQGRIEKRNLSDGQLVTGFGTGGVAIGFGIFGIAIDSTYMYVGGLVIEKRSLTDGSLATGFGTGGVVYLGGGITARSIAIDSTYVYVVGEESSLVDSQWRIEKRTK